jgi:hypothetical protein
MVFLNIGLGLAAPRRIFARKLADNLELEREIVHTDTRGQGYRFYW